MLTFSSIILNLYVICIVNNIEEKRSQLKNSVVILMEKGMVEAVRSNGSDGWEKIDEIKIKKLSYESRSSSEGRLEKSHNWNTLRRRMLKVIGRIQLCCISYNYLKLYFFKNLVF